MVHAQRQTNTMTVPREPSETRTGSRKLIPGLRAYGNYIALLVLELSTSWYVIYMYDEIRRAPRMTRPWRRGLLGFETSQETPVFLARA